MRKGNPTLCNYTLVKLSDKRNAWIKHMSISLFAGLDRYSTTGLLNYLLLFFINQFSSTTRFNNGHLFQNISNVIVISNVYSIYHETWNMFICNHVVNVVSDFLMNEKCHFFIYPHQKWKHPLILFGKNFVINFVNENYDA